MKIYEETIEMQNEVPTSSLMRIMQDVGGRHNKSTGLSKFVLAEKGLFWIILSSRIKIERYPEPGEKLQVITWRGERKRTLLPRYFLVKDSRGKVVFRASALWAMLSRETHKMVNPLKYGFDPEWVITGQECCLPSILKPAETSRETSFVVPEDYIDTNSHMNNTRYFDMCEYCLKDELGGRKLREATIDYLSEAMLGDELKLHWRDIDDKIYIQGEHSQVIFRTLLKYE